MRDTEIRIQGMSCGHCVMSVKKALAKLPGVQIKDVRIGAAELTYDETLITPLQLANAIEEAGYTVQP